MKLFDEFGNAVGDFVPAGDGLMGVGMAIGAIIAGFTIFLIYKLFSLIIKTIVAGAKALANSIKGVQSHE